MKKIYIPLLIILCASTSVWAQLPQIENLSVTSGPETVSVAFDAQIARRAARSGTTVVYAPVITDGEHRVSLPPIVVRGRGASLSWERREWVAGAAAQWADAIPARNGRSVNYTAQVPFQRWMHDARIQVETVTAGCCSSQTGLSILAEGILPAPAVESMPEPVAQEPEPTVTEILQSAFRFVLPASEFDPEEPIKFYDDERDSALTIYYHVNSYDIDQNFVDNRQTLTNLIGAIELIRTSTDSDVERVVVAGFASPEGRLEYNDRLAWERAVSVKEYILRNTDMPDQGVLLFNGSADWRGLRRLIEADPDVPCRAEALDIIDNVPVWDARSQSGRQGALRSLDGGRTYRYLAEKIFPLLRNGAFIRVYFKAVGDADSLTSCVDPGTYCRELPEHVRMCLWQ